VTSSTTHTPWDGKWEQRLSERLKLRGFSSATDYANSRPTTSLVDLADDIGFEDIAAVQIQWRLVAEARVRGTMEQCARSLLARALRAELPEGWHREWIDEPGNPETPLFRKVSAFSEVTVALPEEYRAISRRLHKAFDAENIVEGWIPEGADDPLIVDIFRRHWSDPE